MSRRRDEFVHRTLIFETAFRAWSHLGGLDPIDLQNNPTSIFDALVNPINNDTRICDKLYGRTTMNNPDGSNRRHYPYEPLPRSGLAHPYVRAILTLWLGPDADNETVDKDLKTLRNWWYHRKSGESVTAIADLGTEEMKGVVEGYTRHFFILAHSLVVNDNEQPPRTLHRKMQAMEELHQENEDQDNDEPQVSVPVYLLVSPTVVEQSVLEGATVEQPVLEGTTLLALFHAEFAKKMNSTTTAQCTKIVETVLKGYYGNNLPINGLLDGAADSELCRVIAREVDQILNSFAERVAIASAFILAENGHADYPKALHVDDKKCMMDIYTISSAFNIAARNDSANSKDVFAWDNTCTCPSNDILRDDCARHSQMDHCVLDAFGDRGQQVMEFMATAYSSALTVMSTTGTSAPLFDDTVLSYADTLAYMW